MNTLIFLLILAVTSLALDQRTASRGSSCPTDQVCATRKSCKYWVDRENSVKSLSEQNPQRKKYISDARNAICNRAERAVCCPIDDGIDPDCNMDCSMDACNGLPKQDECGYVTLPPSNIIGGEDASLGEFTFITLIGEPRGSGIIWKCGGTLINRWWVVTAAHCIGKNWSDHKIRLGEHTIDTNPDCLDNGRVCMDEVQDLPVKKAIVHPDYNPNLYNNVINDIALIMLSKPANIADLIGVTTACLPTDENIAARLLKVNNLRDGLVGKRLLVAGWGFTEYDPVGPKTYEGVTDDSKAPSNVLQKLNVPVLSNQDCAEMWDLPNNTIESSKICAGGELNKDSCKGDSGSPLLASEFLPNGEVTEDNSKQWFLMGIVSYGSSYCGKGRPAVHTRVQDFIPWIRQVIGNDKCPM